MNDKKISQILIDGQGWVSSTTNEPIEWFGVNGEMATVSWYRKGNREFNGKYVVEIIYEE